MRSVLLYGTGWLSAGLIAAAVPGPLLNYLLRRWGRRAPGWLYRWHYGLGTSAAVVAMGHTVVSLTRAQLPLSAEIGLWLASAAAALVVGEVVLGATMRGMGGRELARARRYHLVFMAALVATVALHAVLDGPLPPA
jgi:hypothetical protein